jgi:geranylgeranyl pyrophosphate synthase
MLGLAFQITDDLLDVLGSSEEVGKAVGKDDDKLTWTNLKGVEQAKIDAEKAVQKAVDYAQSFDFIDYAFFAPLAQNLLQRVK